MAVVVAPSIVVDPAFAYLKEKSGSFVTIGPSRALSIELSVIQVFVRFVSLRYYQLLPRRHLIQSRKVRPVSDQ